MKTLEELATTGWAQVAEAIPKIILEKVEEAARAARYGRRLVQLNEDLTRTKGREIVVPRSGTLQAYRINTEGTAATESTFAVTSTTITPWKIGVTVKISEEAIQAAQFDVVRQNIVEAGIALADQEDLDVIDTLTGKTTQTAEAIGGWTLAAAGYATLSLSHSKVMSFPTKFVYSGGSSYAVSAIDYKDGKVQVTLATGSTVTASTTPTYYYSARTNVFAGSTAGSISYEDIVGAAALIRANKWNPDFVIVHPNEQSSLIKDSRFIDISIYGDPSRVLKEGPLELGRISGMNVLSTTQITAGVALFVDSKRAAWMAIRRPVELKRWDNPQTDSAEMYFYMEYGVAVSDENAIAISVNHASDYKDM